MATVSFTCFLLGVVLISSVALRHSIDDARPAAESTGVTTNIDGLPEGSLEGHQEDTRAMTTAAESKMLRGRKMGAHAEGSNVAKREVMKVKGSTSSKNAVASPPAAANCDHEGEGELDVECELSGEAKNSTRNSFGRLYSSMNNQDMANMMTKRIGLVHVQASCMPRLKSQVSEALPPLLRWTLGTRLLVQRQSNFPSQTTENHDIKDAAAEVFTFLNKDYEQKAHRRPPINNHHPLSQKNADP